MTGNIVTRATLVAACVALAAATTGPLAHAQTRLTVSGARPISSVIEPFGGLTPAEYDELARQVGANWLPGTTPVVIDYPATAGLLWGSDAPGADQSVATGQANLHTAIKAATADGGTVVVAGLSEGAIVVDRELEHLASSPDAPPDDSVTFVLFGSPSRGVTTLLPVGTYIPVLDYTVHETPDSQYDVSVVFAQYDGWADAPDRPWNVVADVNAVLGGAYHHTPSALADASQGQLVSASTSTRGGTTRTYMLPTRRLPITEPLRTVGVPEQLTDPIDSVLRPVVDAGYSRNDTGPVRLPAMSRGRLVMPTSDPLPLAQNRTTTRPLSRVLSTLGVSPVAARDDRPSPAGQSQDAE